MSLFVEWNSLLLEEYFSPEKVDQDVWIQTTRVELEGIGAHKGGTSGLIEAVKQGPHWLHGNDNIAVKAKKLVQQRSWPSKRPRAYSDPGLYLNNYEGCSAPTYLPYIALWVLAKSETEGSGFYSTVSDLIGESFPNNVRNDMEAVWVDLNSWSVRKQKGRFGRFTLNVLGAHRYIGMAHAQSMITHKDIEGIDRLFGSCKLYSGQNLDDDKFFQLIEEGKRSYYLSAGLKEAMGKAEYNDHLRQFLSRQLDFWDGYIPKPTRISVNEYNQRFEPQGRLNDELAIILKVNCDEEIPYWQIGWRLPANVTGLNYRIKTKGGSEEKAKLEFTGSHIHAIYSVNQENARRVLNQSSSSNVESSLLYTGTDGECNERKIYLRQDKVRVFVWDTPDPSLNDSLIERELPISGPAYLLYSLDKYSNLELYLTNENIEHTIVEYDGLPDQWSLVCINATEVLTSNQRAEIVDEEPAVIEKARIRLVGGRPIIGAGSKKYAYYDLPIIELEGPLEAELIADGLTFIELESSDAYSVRRFKYSLNDGSSCSFKIKAEIDGQVLCSAGLQLLAIGGVSISNRFNFSIDNFGRTLTNTTGLLGAMVDGINLAKSDTAIDKFEVDEVTLSDSNGECIWQCMESNVSSRFLDSIATTKNGSMTYGAARDQIMRLANSFGIDDVQPVFLIRELRRRGHVEIDTDVKGHMVRVCAVPATIYSLPMTDTEQRQLYGVCGSLRLQQWKELVQTSDVRITVEAEPTHNFPVVRLAPFVGSAIRTIAEIANFQVVDLPAQELSKWVGSVQEIKETLSWYPEQGFIPNALARLNPNTGIFNNSGSTSVDPDRKFEFFRYEDPMSAGLQVYKLGRNLGDGLSKYSFIQDSRWGIWMAVNAFAEFVKSIGVVDACPWPIHYNIVTGCLWLPARMEPPFVIERVLTLCSASGPVVVQTEGESIGDSILLSEKGKHTIANISCVYDKMSGGKWLRYRWVPKEIASHIAHLLGGEIKLISSNFIARELEDTKCQLA
ncbi:hypothetical protein BCU33_008280 [Vibrio lentus]|uniref:hypothetical protein n=1 Tax=Vibrio lentus TaxID=136468 RepID=UPI000C83D930|nr:hypothetical protein [Vibrio lentus]PMI95492.1 hypothetical protein BCU33_12425 [Vibrio lentus]